MSRFLSKYLESIGKIDILDLFVQGVSAYLSKKKYAFLPKINWISDKDPKDAACFYFQNTVVRVTKDKLELIPYSALNHKIWKNRILDRDFNDVPRGNGQFEDFCYKLSKENPERFKAFKTAIGYLLHRHNDESIVKAIILLDENATIGGQTNGGTGKSLIFKALSHFVETVLIDGKNMKQDSRFNNQRISHTSDIVNFDDINHKFSLESIYSMTTSGIVIEKKGKDECVLKSEDSPKIMITSNQPVKGPGGSSDIRRRCEFEVPNYFSDTWTPKDEYGKLFFSQWDDIEWNMFDCFMIECVQLFLKEGLLEAKPLKLKVNKLIQLTSPEFHNFISKDAITIGKWIDKNEFLQQFTDAYPKLEDVKSNSLTRWMKKYCEENDLEYTDKKTGEKFEFKLTKRSETGNEKGDEDNL
ncbi:primase-helicase family protein [Flavobacterium sp. 83]|uniref:primase-helicase family protein n=1 Tax=Flavobacterium sp. 83 TaxID=1131812 RepID=UPI00054D65F7|nr:primase-helicase family protein [Flavobacterium sp. 83]